MKKSYFRLVILLIFGVGIISLTQCSNIVTPFQSTLSEAIFHTVLPSPFKINKQHHSPINVNGDVDFHTQAIVEEWDLGGSRNGTFISPYIIEGYNITDDTTNLITIRNTQAYFIIQNNFLDGVSHQYIGISLHNVTHGTLTNNSIQRNLVGVYLDSTANNNSIVNNTITSQSIGIRLQGSMNLLNGNRINIFTEGIFEEETGFKNVLSGNIISYGDVGIHLFDGYATNITNNYISNTSQEGIRFNGRYCNVSYNTIYNCLGGIYLYMSHYNMLADNIIYNIQSYGIMIQGSFFWQPEFCRDNEIYNNSVSKAYAGVCLLGTDNNTVVKNSLYNLDYQGISISGSSSSIAFNTIVNSSDYAINSSSLSRNTLIRWNTLIDNNRNGGSQAHDEGMDTLVIGNYWNEWTEPDVDENGIVDVPYPIDGSQSNQDFSPLVKHGISYHIIPPLFIFPVGGEILSGNVSVKWNAAYDLKEHQILYTLFYSVDDGITWVSLAKGLNTTQFQWNTTAIADDSTYLLNLMANCSDGFITNVTSIKPLIIDNNAPQIFLNGILNNSAVCSSDFISFIIIDSSLTNVLYNWDGITNYTLNSDWNSYQVTMPLLEGYHWLHVYANDAFERQTVQYYHFYVNNPPSIELQTPQNNSIIFPLSTIEFEIFDLSLANVWYQWDSQEYVSFTTPFFVQTINSNGFHLLTIHAQDTNNCITTSTFGFYILDPFSIEITQSLLVTAYCMESFRHSFTIKNKEDVSLNLLVLVIGSKDEVLTGNNSQLLLQPGEIKTVKLEIRPKHDSTHQLEIFLLFEGLVYYKETLKFNVAPQWMSPRLLLPVLLAIVIFLFLILILGTTLLFIRNQFQLRRLFLEQHTQLIWLLDQFSIASLEGIIEKEIKVSEIPFNRTVGFPQNLQLSEPLDRDTLKHQFNVLKEQIINGDPINAYKLSDLLSQVEELLKEP
jgi:parallel beta-helix repeat protein